jgi:hypothetical protein
MYNLEPTNFPKICEPPIPGSAFSNATKHGMYLYWSPSSPLSLHRLLRENFTFTFFSVRYEINSKYVIVMKASLKGVDHVVKMLIVAFCVTD